MNYATAILVLSGALALNACELRDDGDESLTENETQAATEADEPSTMIVGGVPTDRATATPSPEPATSPSGSPQPSQSASPTKELRQAQTIPRPLRGKWREVPPREPGDTSMQRKVTTAQCDNSDYANAGKILNIRDTNFGFFEQGGRLLKIHERSDTRIRATFDTTYADTPTQMDYIFDAQDGGTSLVMREYGKGARPGPFLYKRCPA